MRNLPAPVPVGIRPRFPGQHRLSPLPEPFFERIVAESLNLPARVWREVFDALIAYDDWEHLPRITTPVS